MNLGDFIFGMGAFVMPIVVTFMIRKVGLRKTFLSFSVLVAVPLALCLTIDLDKYVNEFGALKEANDSEQVSVVEKVVPEVSESSEQPELGFADLIGDGIVMLCCLAFFFHVPVEACVGAWATTLSMDRGTSEGKATGLLSVFWLTFTVSRLIAALVLPHGSHEVAVIGFAVVMLLVVYGLIKSQKAEGTNALLIVAGLILGPIFPILIALLVGHVDVALQGRAIGLFFCIGGIGWALIPYLVGRQADKSGLQKSFYIVAASAAGLIISTIVLVSQLGA